VTSVTVASIVKSSELSDLIAAKATSAPASSLVEALHYPMKLLWPKGRYDGMASTGLLREELSRPVDRRAMRRGRA
jgi:hypothetical protein